MNKWLASGLALSLLIGGCGKKEKTYHPLTQELRLNLHGEPPTLDPRKASDTTSISVQKMCFEGLTRIDPNKQPILAAAEALEISSDQKRYTFTLRQANWSDGTPVTAMDFEKTWKMMLDPTFLCESVNDLYIISNAKAAKEQHCSLEEVGVKALDERTLQVDLEHPTPYFLSALSTHSFFPTPIHIINAYPDWIHHHYVTNGAFCLKEWRHQDMILLEKNPHYWDRKNVKLEKISLMLIEEESTELSMFENDELDWAGYPLSTLPIDAISTLNKKTQLEHYMIAGTYYYIFNTKKVPFNNVNIRRAFALAINRQLIVANILQMGQPVALGLIPPMMWKNPQTYFKDNDIAEAKKYLTQGLHELGMTVQELPTITLTYNTSTAHHKIAQAIQEQWHQALGIKVKLENKEWKVFLDELRLQKFQIARMGGLANINDPIAFLDFYRYLSSVNNYSQWTNSQFSELLGYADLCMDAEKRIALLKEAEKVLIQEMPIIPIYFYTGAYLKKPYVKGIYVSELNDLDPKWAYVEVDDQISQ